MNRHQVVEWAPFQVASGTSEAELLAASSLLQEHFLVRQPGFVRRELLRWRDVCWVDVVFWKDRASADAAMKAADEDAACQAYFRLMAGGDAAALDPGVLLLDRVASYG